MLETVPFRGRVQLTSIDTLIILVEWSDPEDKFFGVSLRLSHQLSLVGGR
jgi:hypothetical protein